MPHSLPAADVGGTGPSDPIYRTCRTCGTSTTPDRIHTQHADGAVTCVDCAAAPPPDPIGYVYDAVYEALDGKIAFLGDAYDYVSLEAEYVTPDGSDDGDLVLTVPADGDLPARRYRVVLEELGNETAGGGV